jgi:2-iminoacetate synthase
MTCVALHAGFLMKKFWKSQIAVSFPRLRNAAGGFRPPVTVPDRQLAQAIFALRIVLPDVELVLSTRENSGFRDGMAGIGITRMSAGSKTNPGGYSISRDSLEQFEVTDKRTPAEIASMLQAKNLEPVWKDFDQSILFEKA